MLSSSVFSAYVRRLYLAANPVLAHPLYDLYQQGDSSDEEGDRGGDNGQALSPEAKATAAFAAAQQGEQSCPGCSSQQYGGGWYGAALFFRTCCLWAGAQSVACGSLSCRQHSTHWRKAQPPGS